MALYSGISVMMALLAFSTLIGLANGLKCYDCKHHGKAVTSQDCNPGELRQAKPGDVCTHMFATGTDATGTIYMVSKTSGTEGRAGSVKDVPIPIAGDCVDTSYKDAGTTMKVKFCSCNDKHGCNDKIAGQDNGQAGQTEGAKDGVGGFGSDVNVMLGFGVIALILGYLRQ